MLCLIRNDEGRERTSGEGAADTEEAKEDSEDKDSEESDCSDDSNDEDNLEREEDLTSRPALRFTPKQRKMLSSISQKSNQKKSRFVFSPTSTISSGELSPIPLQISFPSAKSTKKNGEKEEDENAIGSDGSREAPQNPHRRHSNHSLAAVSVSRRHLALSAIRAALDRSTQTCLRTAAANEFATACLLASSLKTGLETLFVRLMQQIGQKEVAALLHYLGKALSHLFNQLGSPQLPKPITIPSSYAGATGGILANDANKFLNLLCGTRLFSLGGEDTVRDAQLVENMRKEMNVWRKEVMPAVEGGDDARDTAELLCEERGIYSTVPDAQNKIN
ncbi:uncharacterized protein MONOS_11870 [Monocercomonoides exilis]|uniref:uncharacterized protein n=1 Tax=Monocercomonoides exilis TaxID=2049356 RepID=UPI003559F8F6|nr:hypothetical protein MONOS_11870 [Monocercomonoides exilis]|eukprot:MONOS_11870.1-p1 / transcript=MONOS_11870.1 / gene=MONOS_11870 / organism=Monocercomonoides_exilis_PA203 / gene_product=unspecified product / transcript_product=unspecified product / location=Mono_scaffold00620:19959-21111(-) / protein_length=334 / sequence_SO=supercontig / SO=protein_coding / is_pseudo=false